jgi:hypothetical protein
MVGELPPQAINRLDHVIEREGALAVLPVAPARGVLDPTGARTPLQGLGLVAVGAADVATGQSEEDLALAHQSGLALDGREDFGDEQRT